MNPMNTAGANFRTVRRGIRALLKATAAEGGLSESWLSLAERDKRNLLTDAGLAAVRSLIIKAGQVLDVSVNPNSAPEKLAAELHRLAGIVRRRAGVSFRRLNRLAQEFERTALDV